MVRPTIIFTLNLIIHSAREGANRNHLNDHELTIIKTKIHPAVSNFDHRNAWRETHDQVSAVLNQADEIGRIMKNNRFNLQVERSWVALRTDLNTLAGVYNLPRLR